MSMHKRMRQRAGEGIKPGNIVHNGPDEAMGEMDVPEMEHHDSFARRRFDEHMKRPARRKGMEE